MLWQGDLQPVVTVVAFLVMFIYPLASPTDLSGVFCLGFVCAIAGFDLANYSSGY